MRKAKRRALGATLALAMCLVSLGTILLFAPKAGNAYASAPSFGGAAVTLTDGVITYTGNHPLNVDAGITKAELESYLSEATEVTGDHTLEFEYSSGMFHGDTTLLSGVHKVTLKVDDEEESIDDSVEIEVFAIGNYKDFSDGTQGFNSHTSIGGLSTGNNLQLSAALLFYAWINIPTDAPKNAAGNYGAIISNRNQAGNNYTSLMSLEVDANGYLTYVQGDGTSALKVVTHKDTRAMVVTGKWTHVAVFRTGNQSTMTVEPYGGASAIVFYINGEFLGYTAMAGNGLGDANRTSSGFTPTMRIGRSVGNNYAFMGKIASVTMHNHTTVPLSNDIAGQNAFGIPHKANAAGESQPRADMRAPFGATRETKLPVRMEFNFMDFYSGTENISRVKGTTKSAIENYITKETGAIGVAETLVFNYSADTFDNDNKLNAGTHTVTVSVDGKAYLGSKTIDIIAINDFVDFTPDIDTGAPRHSFSTGLVPNVQPNTVQSWVYIPSGRADAELGYVLGTGNGGDGRNSFNIVFYGTGAFSVFWKGANRPIIQTVAVLKVPFDNWTHIAAVREKSTKSMHYYINGEHVYTHVEDILGEDIDAFDNTGSGSNALSDVIRAYSIGGDGRANMATNRNRVLPGSLATVAAFSEMRTPEQIKSDMLAALVDGESFENNDDCWLWCDFGDQSMWYDYAGGNTFAGSSLSSFITKFKADVTVLDMRSMVKKTSGSFVSVDPNVFIKPYVTITVDPALLSHGNLVAGTGNVTITAEDVLGNTETWQESITITNTLTYSGDYSFAAGSAKADLVSHIESKLQFVDAGTTDTIAFEYPVGLVDGEEKLQVGTHTIVARVIDGNEDVVLTFEIIIDVAIPVISYNGNTAFATGMSKTEFETYIINNLTVSNAEKNNVVISYEESPFEANLFVAGTYTVKLNVNNAHGVAAIEVTINISVSKPVVSYSGVVAFATGMPEADFVAYLKTQLETTGIEVDVEDVVITYSATPFASGALKAGSYSVKFNVTDGNGIAATELVINITVASPTISHTGSTVFETGTSKTALETALLAGITVTGAEKASIIITYTGNPFDASNNLVEGTFSVHFDVNNIYGASATRLTKEFRGASEPVIDYYGTTAFEPGMTKAALETYFKENMNVTRASKDNIVFTYTGTPFDGDYKLVAGAYSVKFNVASSDSIPAQEVEVNFTVSKPTIAYAGGLEFAAGMTKTDLETYFRAQLNVTGSTAASVVITYAEEAFADNKLLVGTFAVKFNVTDDNGIAATEVSISITANKPTIAYSASGNLNFATGMAKADFETYLKSQLSVTGTGVAVSGVVISYTGNPFDTDNKLTAGTFTVKFNLSNANGIAATEVEISVTVSKPTIVYTGDLEFEAGMTKAALEEYLISKLTVTGADADEVIITYSDNAFGSDNKLIAGTITIKFNVSDVNEIDADEVAISVTVTAPAPVGGGSCNKSASTAFVALFAMAAFMAIKRRIK